MAKIELKNGTLYKDGVAVKYDTGWISRSDWTNIHLGSNTTKDVDSDVTHNLNANLSEMLVKVLVSEDETDANSFETINTNNTAGNHYGISVYQVDSNNIKIQTGTLGITRMNDDGTVGVINTNDWYYKIICYKLP